MKRTTILLVDDDCSIRELVSQLLDENGYDVLTASNGEDGLSICRQSTHTIGLLLTDVQMPGMSGFELVEHALRLRPQMRVLVMSGNRGCNSRPDHPFLPKPFRRAALVAKIEQALHRATD